MPFKTIKTLFLFLSFFWFGSTFCTYSQEMIEMKKILELSHVKSLDAFKSKRKYAIGYWEYRSIKAKLLPTIDINLQPFTFNRSFTQRYDPINNIDVYRQQRNLNTYGQIAINQKVMPTGATVYLSSTFNRFVNFGDNNVENYTVTPFRIGIEQPIMAFNELKWQNRTVELEYEKDKKEFISQREILNIKSINLFFRWALANDKLRICLENKKNSHKMYEIGKKKYPLGTIERDVLLNLELETFTADTELVKAKQELTEILSELRLFLDTENIETYTPKLPEIIPKMKIDLEDALKLARKHNPNLLGIEINRINASRDLDSVIKENRFDLTISASYGLNQQAETFAETYSSFLDQQIVAVQFSMPLLDWGQRKGNIQKAKMSKHLADIENDQFENEIQQELAQQVANFNLQEDIVTIALRKKNLAKESYQITERRFLNGKVDFLLVQTARKTWQESSQEYINSLREYWEYYYSVRQATLFDFINGNQLDMNYENLVLE